MSEEWRDIPGWEGWYQASTEGRVRAIRRPRKGGPRCFNEEYPLVLTPLLYQKGYFKQHLGNCDGSRPVKRMYLHRIIYFTFYGPIPDGMTVNHKDGNKANNRPGNLELATHHEQNLHARANGLIRWRGGATPSLTVADVGEIRRLHATGEIGYTALAQRYGVWPNAIKSIVLRRSWRHIP